MLPSPLPDDPRKWDGWSRYTSPDYYERLCLTFESQPTNEQIEDHCRQLLVWWQKKLPLKNQPSNPLAQLLRGGMDLAPRYLAQARAELLNPERRAEIDGVLKDRQRQNALAEFQKFLDFALADNVLTLEEEANLLKLGKALGLTDEDVAVTVADGLTKSGAKREADLPPPAPAAPPPPPPPAPAPEPVRGEVPRTRRVRASSPADEFRRMLTLSGLDGESMSDDRRDTFIDMAENMGLDPGAAEDMVDDYLEGVENGTVPLAPRGGADAPPAPPPARTPMVLTPAIKPKTPLVRQSPGGAPPRPAVAATPAAPTPIPVTDPAEERRLYPDFHTSLGTPMVFIPSATFQMGNAAAGAPVNEQPLTRVTLSRFHLSRFPVTNAEYERFDPAHASRRGAWADGQHPVIYVSSLDAEKFCQWLSRTERRRYRLPTEAEWEYAAKGGDGRSFPWGEATGRGTLANYADANTTFAWRDGTVDDGFAETSPVGAYPAGESPFGIQDLAGNVWEWCGDNYEPYKGGERANPRSTKPGAQRVYRGGSWKSRFANLKTTARGYNHPTYASNDVGFRIVCECD